MAATYDLIAEETITTTLNSITFSNIPNTYTDLAVRISSRSARSGYWYSLSIFVNGLTTSIYSRTGLNNTSGYRGSGSAELIIYDGFPADLNSADHFSNCELYIPNYAGSANKIIYIQTNGLAPSGSVSVTSQAGYVKTTNAITSLTFDHPDSSNFITGSHFALYGIKNS